jgi:hypothetical protein
MGSSNAAHVRLPTNWPKEASRAVELAEDALAHGCLLDRKG